jgi:hypothetical protein
MANDGFRPIVDITRSWHNQYMLRLSALAFVLAIGGCAIEQPDAKLCNMPVALRGWSGVTVRMTGIVKGGFEHGFTIMDDHCARGGELIVTSRSVNGDRLLNKLSAVGSAVGVTRIDIEAKIVTADDASPKLLVSRYYGGWFQPMSQQQLSDFDRMRGM